MILDCRIPVQAPLSYRHRLFILYSMEDYPPEYVAHNLPLIILSGFPDSLHTAKPDKRREIFGTGTVITSDLPLFDNESSQKLLQEFLSFDGGSQSWNSDAGRQRNNLVGFKFKVVGRVRAPQS